jgi:hypothetical protein
VKQFSRAWTLANAFFAAPSDGTTAAFFRVAIGLLSLWQALGVSLNLERYYSQDGFVPFEVVRENSWIWLSPLSYAPASAAMLYAHAVVFFVAAAALTVGFFPRAAALVVAFVHVSLQLRNPYILNSGDRLFMIIVALGAAMPLAHRFSVHSLLRARRGQGAFPAATVWGQRLVALQIAYVYINSAISKLANERWRNGMALRDVLASPVFAEWPRWVDFKPLIWSLTYSTLLLELFFPAFVWFKRPRRWFLLWGVGFHVGIDVTMMIPIFSYIMIIGYIAFLTDDETRWIFRKLSRRKRAPAAAAAPTTDSPSEAATA